MPKSKQKIQMFEEDMICPKREDGYMRPDIALLPTSPPKYPHTCDACGHQAVFDVCYPRIVYVYKDNGDQVEQCRIPR